MSYWISDNFWESTKEHEWYSNGCNNNSQGNMRKFGRHMMGLVDSVHKTQQKWNEIYFKKLDTNTEHVKTLQEANQAVVRLLLNKVFDLSGKFIDPKQATNDPNVRTDTALAQSHQQCIDSEK